VVEIAQRSAPVRSAGGADATAQAFGGVRARLLAFDLVHQTGAAKTNVSADELAAVIEALL